jgi:hypothetical protein
MHARIHHGSPWVAVSIDEGKTVRLDGIVSANIDLVHVWLGRDGEVFAWRVCLAADLRGVVDGQAEREPR